MSEIMNKHRAIALLTRLVAGATAGAQVGVAEATASQWPMVAGALTAAVLLIVAALAITLRMRSLENKLGRPLSKPEDASRERERAQNDKKKNDELVQTLSELRNDLKSLRSVVDRIANDTHTLRSRNSADSQSPSRHAMTAPVPRGNAAVPRDRDYDEPRVTEDGVAQLLSIANRIVQESPTTLDAFRASAGSIAGRVVSWPAADGTPVAFIVEHRGSYYAVPNVGKPARLPQEWFNRSDFGVNDEIQRVVSLPRLRRSGDKYDVQEAGVFAR